MSEIPRPACPERLHSARAGVGPPLQFFAYLPRCPERLHPARAGTGPDWPARPFGRPRDPPGGARQMASDRGAADSKRVKAGKNWR